MVSLMLSPVLFGANRPMYWWFTQVSLQILTLATVIAWLTDKVAPSMAFKESALIQFIFMLIVLLVSIQAFYPDASIDRSATRTQLLKTICLVETFILSLLLVNDTKRLKTFLLCLVAAGTAQAIYGSLMVISQVEHVLWREKEYYLGVATGTFINRNHLAGYLEMTISIGIGLLLATLTNERARNWRQWLRGWLDTLLSQKALIRVAVTSMVIGLILTQSRMGNIAFVASMAIVAGIGLIHFKGRGGKVRNLFVSLLIVDLLVLGSLFGLENVQNRLQQTNLHEEQRIRVNELTLKLIEDNTLLGTGLGTWFTAFPEVRTTDITYDYRHAHNDWLQFTSETGVLGAVLLFSIWALAVRNCVVTVLKRQNHFARSIALGCLMGLTSIFLHSATDFNLQIFPNALLLVALIAISQIVRTQRAREPGET